MKKISKPWVFIAIATFTILVVFLVGTRLLGRARNSASRAFTQLPVLVERGDMVVRVSGTGTVEAGVREDVRVTIAGTLRGYYLEDGQSVTAGQILAELEVQDLGLQIEKSRLDVDIQERELNKLYEEETYATVMAEAGGEVNWQVKDGDRVQSGNVIATITDRDYIEVVGRFNASQITAIGKGQTARFSLPEYLLEFTGQVTDVSTIARPGKSRPVLTAYYEVKAEFDNPQNLPDGVLGRMTVHSQSGLRQAAEQASLRLPETVDVRAPMSGTLSSQRQKSGVTVTEGATIGEITDSQREGQLDSQIATASARLRQYYLEMEELLAESDPSNTKIQKLQLDIENQEAELFRLYGEDTYKTITASTKGELQWKVKENDRVSEGNIIAVIQKRDKVETVGLFDTAQISGIAKGQNVEFYLAEYGITVQGKVTEVGNVPKAGDGVTLEALYDVTVKIKNPGNLDANLAGLLKISTSSGEKTSIEAVSTLPEVKSLRAPVAGTISMHTTGGRAVSVGQTLAEISDPDRAEQLKGQIATADLRLRQARLDLEDKVQQQNKNSQKSVIRASMNGGLVLPSQTRGVGDEVTTGTVLATIVDYIGLTVVLPVDELDVAKIKPGQEVRLTADALPGTELSGQVSHVAFEGNVQSGVATFDVTITVNHVDGLKVGMTVIADILVENRQNTLLVPIEAVQYQSGKTFVPIADASQRAEGGPAFRLVEVETGAYNMSSIEIISGITEGQQLVIPGSSGNNQQLPSANMGFGGARMIPGQGGNVQRPSRGGQ